MKERNLSIGGTALGDEERNRATHIRHELTRHDGLSQ